jgi:hypothetical protein
MVLKMSCTEQLSLHIILLFFSLFAGKLLDLISSFKYYYLVSDILLFSLYGTTYFIYNNFTLYFLFCVVVFGTYISIFVFLFLYLFM